MSSEESNWAMLPDLPLYLIFKKLIAYTDLFRFLCVCKPWRLVVITDKHDNDITQFLELCLTQRPLLLTRTTKSPPSLYSLATRRPLVSWNQLSIPQSNIRCSGSSYGWLAFATGPDFNVKVTLYDPFTGDEINDLPPIDKELWGDDYADYADYFTLKVILSGNPCVSREDLYIVAIYDGMCYLALLKYGQKSWTYIDFMMSKLVSADVIFFKGILYAVTNNAVVASIDIIGALKMEKPEAPQPIFILPKEFEEYSHRVYLVESSEGDLLLARKLYDYNEMVERIWESFRFVVYKVVLSTGENVAKLEEVKSLGNDALFLGDNHSMAVSASKFPECKPDCIYFTDDCLIGTLFYRDGGPICNGIYNLKDGTIQKYNQSPPGVEEHMMPPIWLIPSHQFRYREL